MADFFPRAFPGQLQDSFTRSLKIAILKFNRRATFETFRNIDSQRLRVERLSVFSNQSNRTQQKAGTKKSGDALRAMIGKGIEAQLPPGAPVKRRNFIQRQDIPFRTIAASFHVQYLRSGPWTAIVAGFFGFL